MDVLGLNAEIIQSRIIAVVQFGESETSFVLFIPLGQHIVVIISQ